MKRSLLLIILLAIPTFALMLNFGIYTMHDFHVFRQFEFSNCFREGIFPCRWSTNSGMGYGEPVFVFYGQFPYWLGQIFRTTGLSIIDSTKAVFILSILGSGFTMFILARRYWGGLGGLVSSIFYMYAPYRAVDVWVRGALPEALSFVLFPLIFYCLDRFIYLKKARFLLLFSLLFSILIINHNLSTYMITPFLALFVLFTSIKARSLKTLIPLVGAGILSLLLSAFYLLPVIFENSLTTVTATTQSYYSFQLHYATLQQLFLSRFWGYGGSVWGPNDTLSFSVGHLHWLLPVLITFILLIKYKFHPKEYSIFYFSLAMGLLALFLTHGKSEFLWLHIPGMSFVQFPWRFLSPAVFFLSLSIGVIPNLLIKYRYLTSTLAITGVILLNYGFYRPDIWRPIGDDTQFSGKLWDEQRSSALQDFWPKTAPTLPSSFAPTKPQFISGSGQTLSNQKFSQSAIYSLDVSSSSAQIAFPIVYFPGWVGTLDGKPVNLNPDDAGLISLQAPSGLHQISLKFTNTPIRYWGNLISGFFVAFWILGFIYIYRYEK